MNKLLSLQLFRGLAAIGVVAHHGVLSITAFIGGLPEWVYYTFGKGNFGVDFFFVLSGFIIMYIHNNDGGVKAQLTYLRKRFVRVFPVYWFVAATLALAYFLLPNLSASGGRNISFLSSIFLLPTEGGPILSVAWTLIHEVCFYLLFLFYFVEKRLFYFLMLVWALIITYMNINGFGTEGIGRYVFSILNVEFFMGVLTAKLLLNYKNIKLSAPMVFIGCSLMFAGIYLNSVSGVNQWRLIFALGAAILIWGSTVIEYYKPLKIPNILILLGNASYAIYLTHNPLLSIIQRITSKLNLSWEVALCSSIFISVFVGVIFHLFVEVVLIKRTNKFFSNVNRVKLETV